MERKGVKEGDCILIRDAQVKNRNVSFVNRLAEGNSNENAIKQWMKDRRQERVSWQPDTIRNRQSGGHQT